MADDKDAQLLKELKEALKPPSDEDAKGIEATRKAGKDTWRNAKGGNGK
jgi:hypothetical protein